MSQTSITSYFNSRKRPATDDILSSKSKIPYIERSAEISSVSRKIHVVKASVLPKEVKQCQVPACERECESSLNATVPIVVKSEVAPEPKYTEKIVFAKKINAANVTKTSEPSKSERTCSARKELSLGDIRKRLAGSSRLAELRATADKLSKGIQHLKEASAKRNLKEFKSIDVEVTSR